MTCATAGTKNKHNKLLGIIDDCEHNTEKVCFLSSLCSPTVHSSGNAKKLKVKQ